MNNPSATAYSEEVRAAITALDGDLETLSRTIHADPELAFEERRASALLCSWLSRHGFDVEKPVGRLETAFVARAGSPGKGPRIAFLAEYDALPGLGHGCGHNLIAAGAVVAAASCVMARSELPGEILVIGTPAEEGGGGKILQLERGVFEGVDVAMMFHPADRTLPWRHARSAAHLRVTFHGRAAHASKNPEDGINALAAMIQLFVALDGLRQHIPSSARIHGVIREGGAAPNIVPDRTSADFLVRDSRAEGALVLVERFRACAQAAALATGATVDVSETAPLYRERKNNHLLAERVMGYLARLGITVEQPSPANPAGSSDIGNLSMALPVIHPYLAVAPRGTPGHSKAFKDLVCTDAAHRATSAMAASMAQAALDLLDDPSFLLAVKDEFATSSPDIGD